MSLPLVFRTVAQTEFDDAAVWYENQQPGLGADFVAEVQQVLDTIAAHPERYAVASGDVREALVSRFPYCVYYRVKPDRIVIIAVFHTSRDPSIWQGRN
ncbi:MAG TPA: type II toxin-antitoxin system RelE/ParE family toxin [Gemmataceae bacterium]|nr:type II toxin-antitoxin system RelE/ParE family toxin [Gemmataceae bacterium]